MYIQFFLICMPRLELLCLDIREIEAEIKTFLKIKEIMSFDLLSVSKEIKYLQDALLCFLRIKQ